MNERAQHEKLTFESWWVLSWGYRQNNSPTKNQTCWTQECQCPDAWGFCVTHRPSFVRYHRDEIEEAFSFSPILRSFGVLNPRSLPDTIGELRDCGKVCMNIVHKLSTEIFLYSVSLKYAIMIFIFHCRTSWLRQSVMHIFFCTYLSWNPCWL